MSFSRKLRLFNKGPKSELFSGYVSYLALSHSSFGNFSHYYRGARPKLRLRTDGDQQALHFLSPVRFADRDLLQYTRLSISR